MGITIHVQIGRKHKVASYNVLDKVAYQVRIINTDLI